MSERGDGATKTTGAGRSGPNRSPRREARREALRQAAAERAAAARRRRMIIGGVAALVAAGIVVLIVVLVPGGSGKPVTKSAADPLAKKPVVTAGTGTLSKLAVTTLVPGTGSPVKAGQNLTVNYVGVTYKDGKEFDSSWSRSQPFQFVIGQGNVIPGWDQGLIGVKVGSRVQLDIPSNMAYGDTGDPAGPLRFVVDVLSAK